ncbi:MAG: UbiA family prenyltransferase [Candidatus Aquicultorales bacterium]
MKQIEITADAPEAGRVYLARVFAYVEGVKLRETALLTLIGTAAALIAPGDLPPAGLMVSIALAILLTSAGVNGLTCYLDRGWDAKMERTKRRPLPSGRAAPERFLAFTSALTVLGLVAAYLIHPLVALAACVGTFTAVVARKTWVTHYLGIVSSLAPIWMGWLAVSRRVDATLVALSVMVAVWVLIHVWSLMLAYRQDYLNAGLRIFPVTAGLDYSVRWIVCLTIALIVSTAWLSSAGSFGMIFAVSAFMLGLFALLTSVLLLVSRDRQSAWRLYKYSAFPFLGLTFLAMVVDRLL